MQGFRFQDDKLVWERDHETVLIEPWGQDSLRVRATMGPEIRDDLPGALLKPAATVVQAEIDEEHAIIRNGAIAANVSLEHDGLRGASAGIRFLNAATGAELLAETPSYFPKLPQ